MPFDEDINLNSPDGISDEDIRKMNEQADELERIAERAEQAKQKINSSTGASPLAGLGGNIAFTGGTGATNQTNAGSVTSMSKDELIELVGDILEEQKKGKDERSDAQKLIDIATEEREELEKQAKEASKRAFALERKFESGFDDFFRGTGNPAGFMKGKIMGFVGKAGIAGVIILFIYKVAQMIYDEIMNSFKPGGANDIRKQMEDRDKEMIELQDILDRRNGRIFFTGDVDLRQGAPQYTNTERLRDQALRYQALHLGE